MRILRTDLSEELAFIAAVFAASVAVLVAALYIFA